MNRSTEGLLIVTTTFSQANRRQFTKLATKLSCYTCSSYVECFSNSEISGNTLLAILAIHIIKRHLLNITITSNIAHQLELKMAKVLILYIIVHPKARKQGSKTIGRTQNSVVCKSLQHHTKHQSTSILSVAVTIQTSLTN